MYTHCLRRIFFFIFFINIFARKFWAIRIYKDRAVAIYSFIVGRLRCNLLGAFGYQIKHTATFIAVRFWPFMFISFQAFQIINQKVINGET